MAAGTRAMSTSQTETAPWDNDARDSSRETLDRYCEMATEIVPAPIAALVLRVGSISRCIASHGLEMRYHSRLWQTQSPPIAPDEETIILDVAQVPDIQSKVAMLGLDHAGLLLRSPVIVTPEYTLALVIADTVPGKKPTTRTLRLLAELKPLIVEEFQSHADLLTDPTSDVTASIHLDDALREANAAPYAAVVLDQSLTILAISDSMATILEFPREDLIGKSHFDIAVPLSDAIGALYRRALETRVSPPDFEVVTETGAAGRGVFRVTVSPFSPIETRDYFLYVTTREVTNLTLRERALARRIGHGTLPPEPSLAFLQETMVERRSIRSRKEISYLTLRSWRTPIRDWQIKALKALKAHIPPDMPELIGEEILNEITSLVGVGAFRAVVPIPCGHTREGPCLSVEIARAIAARIGIPVVQAFATRPLPGTSHPKQNVRRPPLSLILPVNEPVLLIDDVATSGAHIEEAVRLLKPHTGSVLAVAWIGGDSA